MKFDRAYYETHYRDYERQNSARKLRFYRRLAETAAAGCPRPRILDIGCAFGLFLSHLNPAWDRFGLDASEYAIGCARERVPGVDFAVSAPGEFPFEGPFDVITAFDVFEHIPSLNPTLEWISSNLRPGGGLVFVVPVYDGPTGPLIRFLDKDPSHVHRRSRDFWLGLASGRLGLLEWCGIYRYLFPGGFYLHVVTRRWRKCTPAIACRVLLRGE